MFVIPNQLSINCLLHLNTFSHFHFHHFNISLLPPIMNLMFLTNLSLSEVNTFGAYQKLSVKLIGMSLSNPVNFLQFVLLSLDGWGVLIYSGYKFFTGRKKDTIAEVIICFLLIFFLSFL